MALSVASVNMAYRSLQQGTLGSDNATRLMLLSIYMQNQQIIAHQMKLVKQAGLNDPASQDPTSDGAHSNTETSSPQAKKVVLKMPM